MIRFAAIAVTASALTGCALVDDTPPERGFALSWQLVDAAAGDPVRAPAISCADAGVASILVDALDTNGGRRIRTEFSCDTFEGVTPPMPQSSYQVLMIARAADGKARSQVKFDAENYDEVGADLGLTIFQISR